MTGINSRILSGEYLAVRVTTATVSVEMDQADSNYRHGEYGDGGKTDHEGFVRRAGSAA